MKNALIMAALEVVNESTKLAEQESFSKEVKKERISKAINAVDALKSALKTL